MNAEERKQRFIEAKVHPLFEALKRSFQGREAKSLNRSELLASEIKHVEGRQKNDRYYQRLIVEGQEPPTGGPILDERGNVAGWGGDSQSHFAARTLAEYRYYQWLKEQERPLRQEPKEADLGKFLAILVKRKKLSPSTIREGFCNDLAMRFSWNRKRVGKDLAKICKRHWDDSKIEIPESLSEFLTTPGDPIAALKAAFPISENQDSSPSKTP